MPKKHHPGGCKCCFCLIGFENSAHTLDCFCPGRTLANVHYNIFSDLSLLDKVVGLLCGRVAGGIDDNRFSPSDYSTVGDWVAAGGRLLEVGEYYPAMNLDAVNQSNDFLEGIGSSIRFNTASVATTSGLLQSVGVVGSQTTYPGLQSNTLTGGTAVVLSETTGNPVVLAIELIGDGAVLVTGDANPLIISSGGQLVNCPIWTNFFTLDQGDLI